MGKLGSIIFLSHPLPLGGSPLYMGVPRFGRGGEGEYMSHRETPHTAVIYLSRCLVVCIIIGALWCLYGTDRFILK